MVQRIVFRVDASTEIGLGHLMRCLTLADALSAHGADITFICREHPGFLSSLVKGRGYTLHILPPGNNAEGPGDLAHGGWLGVPLSREIGEVSALLEDGVDWLVMDHYALDHRWQDALRRRVKRILVIDDLADRIHACDMLIDQTLGRRSEDYGSLVPDNARLLLGTRYALLRPGFAAGRNASLEWRRGRNRPERILISMGGVDRINLSARVLEALAGYHQASELHVTTILGPNAPWREDVMAHAARAPFPVEVAIDPPDIPALLQHVDLAIGGGGGSAWERCTMGLASVIVIMADNQVNGARQLEATGASRTIESPADLAHALPALMDEITENGRLQEMSLAAAAIVDGLGVSRVTDAMEGRH